MFIDFCAGPLHAPRSAEPTHDDLKMPALYGEKKKAKQAASASTSHVVDAVAGATSQPCADPNELRPAELKRITRGCLEYLGKEGRGDATYVAHLATATLCLGMAPRQQVLRQLQLGSSFVKKDDGPGLAASPSSSSADRLMLMVFRVASARPCSEPGADERLGGFDGP